MSQTTPQAATGRSASTARLKRRPSAPLIHALSRARIFADPRLWVQVVRLANFVSYSYVAEVAKITRGRGVKISPTASFRNGERIVIGEGSHIGERDVIWAGNAHGRIEMGRYCLIAPNVTITASNYAIAAGDEPIMFQDKIEKDILIGDDVWLGSNVVVLAGVTIGDGAVVAAGAVVTKNLPKNCIAAGLPARVIGERPDATATQATVT